MTVVKNLIALYESDGARARFSVSCSFQETERFECTVTVFAPNG